MAKANPPSGLDLQKAEAHIILHVKETGGFRPTAHSGLISHGELAGLITWEAVNRFLSRYAAKNPGCGFTSLSSCVDKLEKEGRLPGLKEKASTTPPGRKPTPLNINKILSIIRQTLASGRKVLQGETIEFGDAWRGMYWRSVDNRLAAYAVKHPRCGFNDVKSLMEKHGIENIPAGSELPRMRPKSATEIFRLVAAHEKITNHPAPTRSGILRSEFEHASVSLINKDLGNRDIDGLEEMFGEGIYPDNLEEFIVAGMNP